MGFGKDLYLQRYGGMRFDETSEQRKAREAEIDKLEAEIRSGTLRSDDLERVQRRLCDLKGIDWDSDDSDDD